MKIYFLFIILFFSCSQLPSKRTDKLSILQGVTNSTSVEFSIVSLKGRALKFEMRSADGEVLVPEEVKIVSREFSEFVVHKMIFPRNPVENYNLYVYENEAIIDQRLVGRGQADRSRLRLAVVSCSNDFYQNGFRIWDNLAAKNPEYLLMIGDNVYADVNGINKIATVNPDQLWKRYTDVRMSLPIFFQQKLIPVHALWDDHDYGINNGNETYQYKDESKVIFEAFYAQELSVDDWVKGLGVGGLLSLGDFNLYFLDGRSFRSADAQGKHLGTDQEAWLLSKLSKEATPSFLIKGDQFVGGYQKFESFEGNHPQNFAQFSGSLKKLETPFIFLSGDRHLSEIMQFPRALFTKPSFEITSSPIHGKLFPESEDINPWRVVANKSENNFTIISNVARDNHWFLEVENFGESGNSIYRRELVVFTKDLQNNLNEARKRRHGIRSYKRIKRGRRR